jgi:hypothetical protein
VATKKPQHYLPGHRDTAVAANNRSTALAEDLIPKTSLAEVLTIHRIPATEGRNREGFNLLELAPGVGLTLGGDGAETIVYKNLLGCMGV